MKTTPEWVLIHKITEVTGYSDHAIRAKIKRGIWIIEKHWRKAPDNRIVIDINAIKSWMGGSNA